MERFELLMFPGKLRDAGIVSDGPTIKVDRHLGSWKPELHRNKVTHLSCWRDWTYHGLCRFL